MPELDVNAGQYSSAGVKESNDDSCGIRIPRPPLLLTKGIAVVIADGMSGSEAGKEAAEACVQGFLNDYFSTPDSWSVETSGAKILTALNRWLYGQGQQQYGSHKGMVATLSALIVKSDTAFLFHVGDTRIYRKRSGEPLERLTRDHRFHVDEHKSYLSRAMGIDLHLDIDFRSLPVERGDRFLLTTDGIHDVLDDRQLEQLIEAHAEDPEACTRAIVEAALAAGSDDNLTCQMLHLVQLPLPSADEVYQRLTELPFPPPLEAGMVLDGYRILRELHASRRTQVYLAVDTETQQQVVIKTPSVNYEDDAEYIDAFLHEEWVGRRLNSPHVLRVLEPPRRRSCLYYVTEHVAGQTLREWMHDHPGPSLTAVRDIVTQIAAGLRAFHRLEMIHQDLKPENILIDEQGTVKLIDFGSTKIAGIEEISMPFGRDNLLGTRHYTAPEYLQGYPASNVSDIFSLGVISYEMLTGQLPYKAELRPRNLQRVRYRPARQFNPEVPAWMDAALQKATRIDPERRYRLLSEFVHDIGQPNTQLQRDEIPPLLERNPVAFWRGLAIFLLLANLALLFHFMS
ncbi:bifunctional protein-serine/threonine kinase/phosphatase [Thiohalobacter sp. IOR34]|uniref:bifunctional protein-serine/threonine kinase/phosphatase n=1 Tax=Thiohalobacter sp. IOR34 TaxID=3057176 RepID=UPI0025AEE9B1|nr:bifunctional protein-serine/threonine kinase/phosphatase [Thiohalobacter sp. IOR34]WJW76170.1 bifunctional protein-serine/threonine kinase/phosphatase [Thiohalobacter sp. IOR34]